MKVLTFLQNGSTVFSSNSTWKWQKRDSRISKKGFLFPPIEYFYIKNKILGCSMLTLIYHDRILLIFDKCFLLIFDKCQYERNSLCLCRFYFPLGNQLFDIEFSMLHWSFDDKCCLFLLKSLGVTNRTDSDNLLSILLYQSWTITQSLHLVGVCASC